jgi:hypothetical protein
MAENTQGLTKDELQKAEKEALRIEHVLKKLIKIDGKDAVEVVFAIAKYAEKFPEKYSFLKKQLFKAVK